MVQYDEAFLQEMRIRTSGMSTACPHSCRALDPGLMGRLSSTTRVVDAADGGLWPPRLVAGGWWRERTRRTWAFVHFSACLWPNKGVEGTGKPMMSSLCLYPFWQCAAEGSFRFCRSRWLPGRAPMFLGPSQNSHTMTGRSF
jgi:hypothetical protein